MATGQSPRKNHAKLSRGVVAGCSHPVLVWSSQPPMRVRLCGVRRVGVGSVELLMEKFACPAVGERCCRNVVVRPIVAGEGMVLPRIAVDRRVWFAGKCSLD